MRVLTSSVAMMRNELLRVILLVSVLVDLVSTQRPNDAQDDAQRSEELQRHLELGRKLLAAGQLNDALDQYHRTVELDSSNHLNYFRRATVYIAMGRPKNAYSDLTRSLELSPDFVGAFMQRGNLLIKMGQFVEARADFEQAARRGDQAAHERLAYSEEMVRKVDEIEGLRSDPKSLVEAYSRLIEAAPFSSDLRMARADAYLLVDDPKLSVIDLRAVARIVPDSTDLFARISQIMYQSGDLNDALNEIRECVKLDQEHKICKPEYRRLKKIAKIAEALELAQNGEKWEECITEAEKLRNEETQVRVYQMRAELASCHCMSRIAKRASDAIRTCTKFLDEYDSTNVDALLHRAEAHVSMDQMDSAKADYSKVLERDSENQRAKEGMDRVQKLLKQRGKRDYYKILGVSRNANKQEITKAYRNLAQEWHPDNFHDETEKKAAEKKFIEIAAAKEVLTDPEKRKQFDQGVDPLDPESQQQGGHGHPFAQGFNPFGFGGFNPFGGGGGNYQFKFHFN